MMAKGRKRNGGLSGVSRRMDEQIAAVGLSGDNFEPKGKRMTKCWARAPDKRRC